MPRPLSWDSQDLVSKLGMKFCGPGQMTEYFPHLQYGENISIGIKSSRQQAELKWSDVV